MACSNCDNSPINVPGVLGIYSTSCSDCDQCEDVKKLCYLGPDLSCSEIYNGNKLDVVIQKLDAKLCGVLGDFSSYDTACLTQDNGDPIVSQQQFVESVSDFACKTKERIDNFIGLTFKGYKDEVDDRIKLIEVPAVSSTEQNISSTDTHKQVFTKLIGSVDDIIDQLDVSDANWNQCFTTSPIPNTITEGFDALIDQFCLLKSDLADAGITLPTFNNIGSTLPTPVTSSDTLQATVNKIKARVDQIPTFDINALTWGCTAKPSTSAYNLQAAFQSVLTGVNDYKQNKVTFNPSHFNVVLTNADDPCAGKTVSLVTASAADRFFALNSGDTTPGTFVDKIQAGTGISLDYSTTPGKVIVNSAAVGADVKVKVNTSDTAGGFLEDKIEGSTTSGITVTKTTNGGNSKVTLGTSIDAATLWTFLLTFLDTHPATYAEFCTRVSDCLPDCIIPPHVTAIYNPTISTTTTTTTTTIV